MAMKVFPAFETGKSTTVRGSRKMRRCMKKLATTATESGIIRTGRRRSVDQDVVIDIPLPPSLKLGGS